MQPSYVSPSPTERLPRFVRLREMLAARGGVSKDPRDGLATTRGDRPWTRAARSRRWAGRAWRGGSRVGAEVSASPATGMAFLAFGPLCICATH